MVCEYEHVLQVKIFCLVVGVMEEQRVVYCQDLLLMGQDEHFWENIITGDETWCFAYDPATKRQSAEWVGQNSPKPKKMRFQKLRVKKMLIHCGRVTQICVFNTVKLGTSASSP